MPNEKKINGVNVDQLFRIIELIKGKPEMAQFRFRARNTWVDGTHNRGTEGGTHRDGPEVLPCLQQYRKAVAGHRAARQKINSEPWQGRWGRLENYGCPWNLHLPTAHPGPAYGSKSTATNPRAAYSSFQIVY